MLSACSSNAPKLPEFSASGFIADDGVIRMWRLNNAKSQPLVLMVVYSPYKGTDTSVNFFEYRSGNLWQIRSQILNQKNGDITEQLRFDKNNEVIFMQRTQDGYKTPLSTDEITRWRFEAERILETNTALIVGGVKLYQGRWHQGKVTTCEGDVREVTFEPYAENWLQSRAKVWHSQLNLAWLESSEGNQLLMVADTDFCRWQPSKDSL
ncbi:DUF1481 domain-containing protein [Providencia rettgeri]|uniref:Protein of uncharacterized function (DUF1481) n=2 Tax=Morganellaceae TaxID=1903414 RepID=A0A9N8D5N5_PRORE|nr:MULTISPECIES: DUF1481 domain-containing protein [Providencia]MBN7842980.1 DUF1481 domain-containing protein [Providencia rettgeri]MBN7855499.1 DUF1481 domain-containing protein [Providencia rettgeri]MBN7863237.1 DUF1481 domain-containing protein [Providencia rettgeri]MBN7872721.1 DUF1481 domain-containing protein [Providencia rettgeri]MBN7897725.1 DUF1481 domain-containing protein [Providencia rettgeri]